MKNLILKFTQTKINYYLSLITDFLTGFVFFILAIYYSHDILLTILLFILGVLSFTFIEYAVYAWLFHENHKLKIFIEGHANHHKNPFGYDAMPFFVSFVVGLIFVYILHFIMPIEYSFAIVGGIALGYFNYGIMHHIMHRTEFKNRYWRYMQEFHFVHHKKPKFNHGITTDFWDKVFHTYYKWNEKDLEGIEKLKKTH